MKFREQPKIAKSRKSLSGRPSTNWMIRKICQIEVKKEHPKIKVVLELNGSLSGSPPLVLIISQKLYRSIKGKKVCCYCLCIYIWFILFIGFTKKFLVRLTRTSLDSLINHINTILRSKFCEFFEIDSNGRMNKA